MGKPGRRERRSLLYGERTRGTETSQYPEEEESIEMPGVAASETGRRPNRRPCAGGVVGPTDGTREATRGGLGRPARDGESPGAQPDGRGPAGLWDPRTGHEKRREVAWDGPPETVRAR